MASVRDERHEPFVRMLANLREPLVLVTRVGVIVAANVEAAEALGTTTSALAGTSLSALASDSADLEVQLGEAARGEAVVPLRMRDGRRFSCHPSVLAEDLLLLRLSGGPDPATRARTFFEMLPRLETMARTAGPATLEELSRTMLPFGMSSVGARAGAIYVRDADGLALELGGYVGIGGYYEDSVELFRIVPIATSLPITDCVRETKAIFLCTREEYETAYPAFSQRHSYIQNALVCLPLVIDGRCIGGIALGADAPWQLGDAERAFLDAFTAQCALAVERARHADPARADRDTAAAAERLERLHGFTGALARAITPADVAEVAVDAGMAATGALSGRMWLVDDGDRTVSLVRSVGATGPQPEHHARVPLDRPSRLPILDAIQSGAPVWIESCRQLEAHYPEAFAAFSRSAPNNESSLACVPLMAHGRCIGGLVFNFDHARRFFEHERAFFQMITWYAAQAHERARLYAVEQRARASAEARQRRSAFLAESDLLLGTLDYASVVEAIASIAVPRIADWCIVVLEEERLRGMPPFVKHVDPAKIPPLLGAIARRRALGDPDGGIYEVARTGKSAFYPAITVEMIRRAIPDQELAEFYVQTGVGSSLMVPIAARGRTLGAIHLSTASPNRRYDEDDLAMAEELGRKVGLALDNARMYRDAREEDRLKDEFLAMLSHELRNPLVPIVAAVDLMGLHDNEQFVQERELIQRNAQHLVRLVDDLLDVSRITRGKISLTKERCEVVDLVRDAIDIALPLVEERKHRLLVAAPPRGLAVLADRIRMAQAIANLLTNAAKYTEPGGTITVTAEAHADNAVIRVTDTGIGIDADVLPRIFDIFVQGPDLHKGGLGIGLTIVKRLVELHGGTVSAYSDGLDRGSELAIYLPLTALDERPASPNPPRTATPILGNGRVLVVDDNRDAALVISHLMVAIGYTTHIAHDAFGALEAAPEFHPDLALLDLGLPLMDGYELARRLRQMYPSLRLIAVTGFGQPSDRVLTREAGFDEHIVKPVTLDGLRHVLETMASANH